MKKYYFLIIVALILGLVLTGCTLLSNIGQAPATSQSGITYLTKSPDTDLVGLWHFDEGIGTTAYDSSGNPNDGTLMGDTSWTSGKFGDALSFDGDGDYVEVSDLLTLEPSTITVEAWVKNSGTPGKVKYIISKVYDDKLGSYSSYAFYTGGSGGLRFYVGSASTWVGSPDAGASLWDGNWHHIAGIYDGSNVRLFVDGSQVGTGTSATLSIAYDVGNLYIGYYGPYAYPTYFPGLIDEVRIWDVALNEDAIQQSYELGGAQTSPCVVQLNHQVLASGEVVCFTSAFYLGRQDEDTDKTVDIYIMSASGERTIEDVDIRGATPAKTNGSMISSTCSGTQGTALVNNGLATTKGKTSTSIHLYAELDVGDPDPERLGVNTQYLPWD